MKATAILALLLTVAAARAGEKAANEITWENERVVVFKDGFALVVKKGTAVSDDEGRVVTEEVPDAAVLGTFWAAPAEGRLLSTHAGREPVTTTTKSTVEAQSFADVLRINKGKTCEVRLSDGRTISGPVLAVGKTFFRIGDQLLLTAAIASLRIEGMTTEYEKETTTKKTVKRLTFRFEGGKAEREIRLMYFRPGVRWIPTYRVDLPAEEGGDEVTISLQAEILNEAEDLLDVPIDLVVGVPNFRFKDVVSPMVLEKTLRRALAHGGGGSNRLQNTWSQFQMVPQGQRDPRDPQPGPVDPRMSGDIRLPEDIRAAGTQDLFVYSLPKMTLAKGHRAAVPIFTAKSAMKHVYTFDHYVVHRRDRETRSRRDESPLRLSTSRVWHQLELTNATRVPWTTGAVLLMRGGQPLAQEMLTYTPVLGKSRVPITVAVDLRGRYSEEEISRNAGAMKWAGYTYARIDMEGGVTLTSHKEEAVEIEVNVHVGGRAEEISNDGVLTLTPFRPEDWTSYRGMPDANNHSELRWRMTLEPGQSIRMTARYHFFVRH
jgi:hypothetical protein